jgi:hypothetical protein
MYASVQKIAKTAPIIKPDQAHFGPQETHCRLSPQMTLAYLNFTIKGHTMLYTIAVVLIILWLLGLVTSYTIGGFIHILLVIAVIMVLLRLISGRGL